MRNPSSRNHNQTPYKSELCLRFQRNNCYKGENCYFAHSMSELNSYSNGVSKPKICFWSFSGKQCPYGYKCHYLHKQHESMTMGVKDETLVLKDETLVREYKTKLCEKWERFGRCGFGLKCKYAHGQSELDAYTKKLYRPEQETVTKKLYLSEPKTRTKNLQVKKHSWMGWSAEKIGRIYGDWIDCMDVIQCPTS